MDIKDLLSPISAKIDIGVNADITEAATAIAKASVLPLTARGIKKIADALRHAKLQEAQTEVDAKDILEKRKSYKNNELVEIGPYYAQLDENIDNIETQNFAKTLDIGLEQISYMDERSIPDQEIDSDWFLKWRQAARSTTREEMRNILGKVFADEVKAQNTVSYRTLDVIRNLSGKELQTFTSIAPLIFNGNSLLYASGIPDFEYEDLLLLFDAGLIQPSQLSVTPGFSLDMMKQIPKGMFLPAMYFNDFGLAFQNDVGKIPIYKLTTAGMELYKIIDIPPSQQKYIEWAVRHIYTIKNSNMSIKAYRKIKLNDPARPLLMRFDTNDPIFELDAIKQP